MSKGLSEVLFVFINCLYRFASKSRRAFDPDSYRDPVSIPTKGYLKIQNFQLPRPCQLFVGAVTASYIHSQIKCFFIIFLLKFINSMQYPRQILTMVYYCISISCGLDSKDNRIQ